MLVAQALERVRDYEHIYIFGGQATGDRGTEDSGHGWRYRQCGGSELLNEGSGQIPALCSGANRGGFTLHTGPRRRPRISPIASVPSQRRRHRTGAPSYYTGVAHNGNPALQLPSSSWRNRGSWRLLRVGNARRSEGPDPMEAVRLQPEAEVLER